jgi:O-antigen/teichoic acid export membrane protein
VNKVLSRWTGLQLVLKAKSGVVLRFLTAQGLTTGLNLLFGLACVRLMLTTEYAKFVVVNGIMGTVLVLMDLSLTSTMVPLVGERVDDRRLIANYVASLRQLSNWMYVLIALGTMVAVPYLVKNRDWSRGTVAAMVAAIVLTTWFMRVGANYFPVMMMTGGRDAWYKINVAASAGMLVLLLSCWAMHWLGALQAIVINVLGYAYIGGMAYRRVRQSLGMEGRPDREKQKAIVRLALPNMPQGIFFALQGQLSLYLMTFFGRTKAVASIGALSRLGQIFVIFLLANSLLIEPYFGKMPKEKLKKNFTLAVAVAMCIAVSVWSLAAFFPGLLLLALGSQYSGMHYELRLAVGASAINCVTGVLWAINSSRRFVYWWNVGLNIAATFVVQAMFIWKGNLTLLETALWMNLAVNVAALVVNSLASMWGFVHGPREAEHPAKITDDEEETLAALNVAELRESTVAAATPLKMTEATLPEEPVG